MGGVGSGRRSSGLSTKFQNYKNKLNDINKKMLSSKGKKADKYMNEYIKVLNSIKIK